MRSFYGFVLSAFIIFSASCTKDPYIASYNPFYITFAGPADLIGRDVLLQGNTFVVCGYGRGVNPDQDFELFFIDSLQHLISKHDLGTEGEDQCWSFTKASDGGFVIAGWTDVNDPAISNDILIVKTNAEGLQQWAKIYGGDYNDIATHIEAVDDGFIVTGIKGGNADENSWILRLDQNGDTLWTFTYGGNQNDGAMSVCKNQDETFAITGYTNSSGNGSTDGYVMLLNPNGEMTGYYTFGTPEYEEPHCIDQLNDGWIISGHAGTLDIHTHDVFLQFIHTDGTMGRFLTYGGPEHDGAEAMTVNQNRILIAGRSASANPLQSPILIETDLSGNQTSKIWLGNASENPAYGLYADQNQVLITGYTLNPNSGQKELFLLRK